MECLRCGNKDPTYFYKGSRGYYCRKCINYKRVLLDEELEPFDYEINSNNADYEFSYSLTDNQKQASRKCLNYLGECDVLLHCVCGAGKTEIVVESIAYYLAKGLKVCFAISRKEVVVELSKRFEKIFYKAKVVSVYGKHHDVLYGDLIVCTCHQLYRYYKCFDLLILDEVDAYPLKGNDTLMNISLNSCAGRIIFSTATINKDLINVLKNRNYKTVELFVRPSNAPLIIPKVIFSIKIICLLVLIKIMNSMTNQGIIFVESKNLCRTLYQFLNRYYSITYVYSDLDLRNENIKAFKEKKYQFIVSTSVLERGVTFLDIDVVIIDFNMKMFDESSIIQMLGRVGRNINNPKGKAYILSNNLNMEIYNTMKYLKKANSYL